MKHFFKGIFIGLLLMPALNAFCQQTVSTPQFRREFLEYINKTRERGCNCGGTFMPPARPLVWNDQLEIAAMGHARDMAERDYFSHTSKDGRTMDERIRAAGYTYNGYKSFMIGENIAMGQMTIAEVMHGWFKSPGHCHNLMNQDFKEVGVAKYGDYWVQDFGGRMPFSAQEQRMIKSGKYRLIQRQ